MRQSYAALACYREAHNSWSKTIGTVKPVVLTMLSVVYEYFYHYDCSYSCVL